MKGHNMLTFEERNKQRNIKKSFVNIMQIERQKIKHLI